MAKDLKRASKKSAKTPLVSVVMSVYNGEKYLREAIDSILNQTFTDFEFIIINDGSTDDTLKIIKSYKDPRIVLISRKNKGLVASLNEGIEKARGKYIARMDADDISLATRFEEQIKLLNKDSNLVLVGTGLMFIDKEGRQVALSPMLASDVELRLEMLIRCPFAHSSIMYRRDTVKKIGLYDRKLWPAEDYDLWVRLAEHGKMANVNDILVKYRVNEEGISSMHPDAQADRSKAVSNRAWRVTAIRVIPPKFADIKNRYENNDLGMIQKARLASVYYLVSRRAKNMNLNAYGRKVRNALCTDTNGVARYIKYSLQHMGKESI